MGLFYFVFIFFRGWVCGDCYCFYFERYYVCFRYKNNYFCCFFREYGREWGFCDFCLLLKKRIFKVFLKVLKKVCFSEFVGEMLCFVYDFC